MIIIIRVHIITNNILSIIVVVPVVISSTSTSVIMIVNLIDNHELHHLVNQSDSDCRSV